MTASPSTNNYSILQATVAYHSGATVPSSWDGTMDVGNCLKASLKLNATTKQHFSRRTAVRSVDLETVSQKAATLDLELDEYTAKNLQLALAGDALVSGSGSKSFNLMGAVNQVGWVNIVGTNSIGTQVSLLAKVSVNPSGTLELISPNDDFDSYTISMTVLADDSGNYGKITVVEPA